MKDNRYQFQSRPVKAIRWLRHKPVSWVVFIWRLLVWARYGCQPVVWTLPGEFPEHRETRWETACSIWGQVKSMCEYRMGHYYTSKEFLAELRAGR